MRDGGERAEILRAYELHYADLLLLSSPDVSSFSGEENERLLSMTTAIMDALGPYGSGLIAIVGVPNSSLRLSLLPLARRLTLLNPDSRKRILKEHNLGSDVSLKNPDRNVSSFARQLKYRLSLDCTRVEENMVFSPSGQFLVTDHQSISEKDPRGKVEEDEFKNLGNHFEELGTLMMDLGLHLARICDRAIGGQELEKSLLESGTAKGRLIHYHSTVDKMILNEVGRRRGNAKRSTNSSRKDGLSKADSIKVRSDLWQQWHYDYGIFTILTAPMFLSPSQNPLIIDQSFSGECNSPSGHTHLQIFNPSTQKNNVRMVNAPPDCFIIQVGESADIISKGKLRSTLHSVSRPSEMEDLCRETFVVFLQPAWDKSFSVSEDLVRDTMLGEKVDDKEETTRLHNEIYEIVPPLGSRLKDGMTFAEFSYETTKQYYGGRGLQSNT